jgi:hypothetical protein
LGVSVSEVHAYPPRPEGFEETLFPTVASKQAVAEHLLRASWLVRASELGGCGGEIARASGDPVEVEFSRDDAYVVRASNRGRRTRGRARGRRILEVLESWREVRGWWGEGGVDRLVFRVALSGGAIVDLACEESSRWFLAGVAD